MSIRLSQPILSETLNSNLKLILKSISEQYAKIEQQKAKEEGSYVWMYGP